jgi:hypothetical protein
MTDPTSLPRRTALVALAAAPLSACSADPADRALSFTRLGDAMAEVERLAAAAGRTSATGWNWAHTLVHCAQSIEYSMSGFPQSRSRLFQVTAGSAAFLVFEARGRMRHDLTEPIPGAPAIDAATPEAEALERLRRAAATFAGWNGSLQPHFAYGALDKARYEAAHAMHVANHLSFFRA